MCSADAQNSPCGSPTAPAAPGSYPAAHAGAAPASPSCYSRSCCCCRSVSGGKAVTCCSAPARSRGERLEGGGVCARLVRPLPRGRTRARASFPDKQRDRWEAHATSVQRSRWAVCPAFAGSTLRGCCSPSHTMSSRMTARTAQTRFRQTQTAPYHPIRPSPLGWTACARPSRRMGVPSGI